LCIRLIRFLSAFEGTLNPLESYVAKGQYVAAMQIVLCSGTYRWNRATVTRQVSVATVVVKRNSEEDWARRCPGSTLSTVTRQHASAYSTSPLSRFCVNNTLFFS